MTHEHIEMVRRIDFDQLDILVSERIGALKLYAQNIDKAKEGKEYLSFYHVEGGNYEVLE